MSSRPVQNLGCPETWLMWSVIYLIALCNSHSLGQVLISAGRGSGRGARAEENDKSMRNQGDKPVRSRTGAQVSDVAGDKKDENLQPWSRSSS
jgi:hypothetical protein